ncbi:MAG TPA: hypothetical protein VH413_08595 [Verrucomicrobiae bacterium]|jgi:hypothetical protein|nr:hypothetical protein [Verrucomicrobiae bacterium]
MKVLIQDFKSGKYLAANGTLTSLPSQAKDFRYSSYARSILRREKFSGLSVHYYFEDMDYSIKVRNWQRERLCQQLNAAAFDF